MKTTRINTGIYKIENEGIVFQCEKTYDNKWMMLVFIDNKWEYCQHYYSLSDCKWVIENQLNEIIN